MTKPNIEKRYIKNNNVEKNLVVPKGFAPNTKVIGKIQKFFKVFPTLEKNSGTKILLMFDKRSEAYYINCHLDSNVFASKTDLDTVLDPRESEDYKLNRGIYTDNYAYRLMESDALKGRSFEDLVMEYDFSYRPQKPLKVFGGQHRIMAIGKAIEKDISVFHGARIYFDLSIEQKVDIAMANNTSIAISNDLLDRMNEDLLGTGLRDWCQTTGILEKGQNFADKRSPEGISTVRIARTLLINFYLGKDAKKDTSHLPIVCFSGPGLDEYYKELRKKIQWSDRALKLMGQQFARLHKLQRQRVFRRTTDRYIEFANKATHPCVAASWAYASGFFQRDSKALAHHYALAEAPPPEDPLNAKALLNSRLKGVDPDTYRGLGARINNVELGRMLEVFFLQATKAKQHKINLQLTNAAIKSYEAKKAKLEADKALERI